MSREERLRELHDAAEQQARRGGKSENRLWDFARVGPNPGRLRARVYVPEGLPGGAPLVVVLHGSLQSAAEYDDGTGWSTLADQHGFALLFPQQRRQNNAARGFNWFRRGDSRRDLGEPVSIIAMIRAVGAHYDCDPRRVFVTGLSSGGAMTSVLLATYPEMFAGGAIIAGLAYAPASSLDGAKRRMSGDGVATSSRTLAADVRSASPRAGPWPIVSVWRGGRDETVDPLNADEIVAQWCALHEVGEEALSVETIEGHTRRRWRSPSGRDVVEEYLLADIGHGTPILAADGLRDHAPAYMLAGSLSSTQRIATFWGIGEPQPPALPGDEPVASRAADGRC